MKHNGLLCSISSAGTDNLHLLHEVLARPIDDITISLDSADEKINDTLRGKGSFQRAVHSIEVIIKAGIPVRVTTTVNQLNKNGLSELLSFLQELGVFQADFHLMSLNGGAKAHNELEVSPNEWVSIRESLKSLPHSKLALSVPYIWVNTFSNAYTIFKQHCEMFNKDRFSIMPNGDIYTCTLAIGEEPPIGNILQGIKQDETFDSVFSGQNVCRCERQIGTTLSTNYKYLCRFIKEKLVP